MVLFVRYPPLIPHPGEPGLGNVVGYYRTSLAGLGASEETKFRYLTKVKWLGYGDDSGARVLLRERLNNSAKIISEWQNLANG